jgi:hypothetical protein
LEDGVDLLTSRSLSLLALDIVGYLHGVRFGCRGREVVSTADFLVNVAGNEAGENPLKLFVRVRAQSSTNSIPTLLKKVSRGLSFHHCAAKELPAEKQVTIPWLVLGHNCRFEFFLHLRSVGAEGAYPVQGRITDVLPQDTALKLHSGRVQGRGVPGIPGDGKSRDGTGNGGKRDGTGREDKKSISINFPVFSC